MRKIKITLHLLGLIRDTLGMSGGRYGSFSKVVGGFSKNSENTKNQKFRNRKMTAQHTLNLRFENMSNHLRLPIVPQMIKTIKISTRNKKIRPPMTPWAYIRKGAIENGEKNSLRPLTP